MIGLDDQFTFECGHKFIKVNFGRKLKSYLDVEVPHPFTGWDPLEVHFMTPFPFSFFQCGPNCCKFVLIDFSVGC
jgi:hypothetical protein